MNIYRISVWGPCDSEPAVLSRLALAPDNVATVFAPSKDIANQVCYLVATRNLRHHSNYQDIDTFPLPVACILDTAQDPFMFESDIVNELTAEPILPAVNIADTQAAAGDLFRARCVKVEHRSDRNGTVCGQFWVYAPDPASANTVATEHGNTVGLFDLDEEAIRVELLPLEKTCVFWNIRMTMYDLHNKAAGGDA